MVLAVERDVWAVGGANAQDPQGWKMPWGMWGVGLRLKEQTGPRCAFHPWSQGAGDLTWEPSKLPGLQWVGQMPSFPLLLLWSGRAPPLCLCWSPRPPSYAPKDLCGLEGSLEGRGLVWELSRLPCLSGWGNHPLLLSCSSWTAPPACHSWSPQPQGSHRPSILSGLHFSSPLSPPMSYQFTLGFLPPPWASEPRTRGRQAP